MKTIFFPALAIPALCAGVANGYVYNASDFATSVQYVQGNGVGSDSLSPFALFNDASTALGRPTVDTTGDLFNIPVATPVPVVPNYGAFRANEVVTIGEGGYLVLRFDHQVTNDPNNPFDLDLILFGNAQMGGSGFWTNGNPNQTTLSLPLFREPATVSVSQDGEVWHAFINGPYADDFAPTLGRVYDPSNANPSIGAWNQWWGAPTNPTLPLDPAVTGSSLAGKSVAQAAQLYGESAGGMGFDIGILGLDWIQYVKIVNPTGSGMTPEIDAVADVAALPEPGGLVVLAIGAVMLRRRRLR